MILYTFAQVAYTGKRLSILHDISSAVDHRRERIKLFAWFVTLVAFVLLLEHAGAPHHTPTKGLLVFHLAMVAGLLLAAGAIVFRYTGEAHPAVHRILVWRCFFPCMVFMIVTGAILALQLW